MPCARSFPVSKSGVGNVEEPFSVKLYLQETMSGMSEAHETHVARESFTSDLRDVLRQLVALFLVSILND